MGEELKKKLFRNQKTGWEEISEEEKQEIEKISKSYMDFLNRAKTEREFIKEAK